MIRLHGSEEDSSYRTIRRTLFFGMAAWSAIGWTSRLFAQSGKPIVIGFLNSVSREALAPRLVAFKEGLAALGWREGSQISYEERWADGRNERLQGLAEDLVAKGAAVIVVGGSPPTLAALKAAPNTPIVMASGGDPVAAGLVASFARPGGTITGLTSLAGNITEKYLELLREVAPELRRVGFLVDSTVLTASSHVEAARRSSSQLSVAVRFAEISRLEDIAPGIARLMQEGIQALVIMPSTRFAADRLHIVKLALSHRLPVIAQTHEYVEAGALLSYGADPSALYRRAAHYVDRILKGAKPGDLPIERPTQFEMVVNLKTAKELGLKVPQSLLLRAARVIE